MERSNAASCNKILPNFVYRPVMTRKEEEQYSSLSVSLYRKAFNVTANRHLLYLMTDSGVGSDFEGILVLTRGLRHEQSCHNSLSQEHLN
jgi:hypothetical protein